MSSNWRHNANELEDEKQREAHVCPGSFFNLRAGHRKLCTSSAATGHGRCATLIGPVIDFIEKNGVLAGSFACN